MSVTAAKVSTKLIRITNSLIDTFVLIIIILLIVFSGYAIWDSGQVHSAASSARYERFNPITQNDGMSFQALQAINSDVFAWLTIYGTNIDYPVVQGEDNIRYVNTSAEGRHSLSGAIFLDYRSAPDFSDFSSLFYGHHMENATMFGEIGMFHEADYFEARKYGMLYYGGQEHGLEFFAFVHADAYDSSVFRVGVTGTPEQQAYLDLLLDMAIHVRDDVSVTTNDRIVLLSTCSADSTNGRDILLGKITDTVSGDTFITENTGNVLAIPTIDELRGLDGAAGWAVRVGIIVIPCFLILLASILLYKKSRKKERHTKQ